MRRSLLSCLMPLALPLSALAGGPPLTAEDLAALQPSFTRRALPEGVSSGDTAAVVRALRGESRRPLLVLIGEDARLFSLKAYQGHHHCTFPQDSADALGRVILPRMFELVALPATRPAPAELLLVAADGQLRARIALGEQEPDHGSIFKALRAALGAKVCEKIDKLGGRLIRDFLYYRYIRWMAEQSPAVAEKNREFMAHQVEEQSLKIKAREAEIGLVRSLLDQPFRQSYDRD